VSISGKHTNAVYHGRRHTNEELVDVIIEEGRILHLLEDGKVDGTPLLVVQ
jgi:hypothetical protein